MDKHFECLKVLLKNMSEINDETSFHPIFESLQHTLEKSVSKSKAKKKKKNDSVIDPKAVREVIVETSFKLPICTVAFESIRDFGKFCSFE
jgi:hypothetical protein